MAVLVVTKPTNLELHGSTVEEQMQDGHLGAGLLEQLRLAHDEHYRSIEQVKEALVKSGIAFEEVPRRDPWPTAAGYDGVFTVGGDGTLLAASHNVEDETPVIGVRSSGSSVGYLCAGNGDDAARLVSEFASGQLALERRARLRASIVGGRTRRPRVTHPVLNDFLFTNENPAATTRYRIRLGDVEEIHKSSGLWIATPTGSTAGIAAAGGEAMVPTDARFQYRVRELYRGEGLDYRVTGAIFDPDVERLVVESHNPRAMLALDGQRGSIHLNFGDQVSFERAPPLMLALPERCRKRVGS